MIRHIRKFFELEAATGILLLIATALSLLAANSAHHEIFENFFTLKIVGSLTTQSFINDALMAIFFLFVGLELKKELLIGELSSFKRTALPAFGAVGGTILPAIIFYFFNHHTPENLRGFAVPTATDIAFAYGVICLFGKKIPKSLKVFLISLAIFDDLIAIGLIAVFYAQEISVFYLLLSLTLILLLWILNRKKVANVAIYLALGVLLWLMISRSGIHATLSGVVLSFFIPLKIGDKKPLENFAHKLAPSVNFLILPIFAFSNAGVCLRNMSHEAFTSALVAGTAFGLFFGKQLGVFLVSWLAIKLEICHMPRSSDGGEVGWLQFYGVMILTGIGFTMSLFIGSLAFTQNAALFDEIKIGVLAGSLLSTICGCLIIFISTTLFPKRAGRD